MLVVCVSVRGNTETEREGTTLLAFQITYPGLR